MFIVGGRGVGISPGRMPVAIAGGCIIGGMPATIGGGPPGGAIGAGCPIGRGGMVGSGNGDGTRVGVSAMPLTVAGMAVAALLTVFAVVAGVAVAARIVGSPPPPPVCSVGTPLITPGTALLRGRGGGSTLTPMPVTPAPALPRAAITVARAVRGVGVGPNCERSETNCAFSSCWCRCRK